MFSPDAKATSLEGPAGRPGSPLGADRPWRAIFTGDEAEAIARVVREIAEAIRANPGIALESAGFVRGAAGLSMLFSYLGRCGLVDRADESADEFLEHARRLIAREPGTLSLYYGLAGVGAAAASRLARSPDAAAERLARTVDHVVGRALDQERWDAGFDLLTGVIGLGVYAGYRLDQPFSHAALASVVRHLEVLAERDAGCAAWRVPGRDLVPTVRALHPDGYFDLGLAHGVPGVIAFLAHCVHLGIEGHRAEALVTEALAWVDAQNAEKGGSPRYPNFVSPSEPDRAIARIAWCHGDPSVGLALWTAAQLTKAPALERRAIALVRDAAAASADSDGIADAGLCHGSAGVAHLLNRMAQHADDPEIELAARRWFGRVIAMRDPVREVAGFPMKSGPSDRMEWSAEPGVLFGAAGVALALAASIRPVPPDWDRMLLLSWPSPPPA